jgi:phenylacetic acid degradation operon negative regulatory protein
MVRQGWLEPIRLSDGPGYALTPRAVRRLDDAAARIYRTQQQDWDGRWHLVVTRALQARSRRERLRAGMTFLGYAQLDDATWIGPRISDEVDALLEAEEARADRFTASHDGDPAGLVRRAWDLEGLARSYLRWLAAAKDISTKVDESATDEEAFAARSRLVHEWRKFLFLDPGLPRELLPEHWPGELAAEFFDHESARLLPAAARFVDSCLSAPVRGQ